MGLLPLMRGDKPVSKGNSMPLITEQRQVLVTGSIHTASDEPSPVSTQSRDRAKIRTW